MKRILLLFSVFILSLQLSAQQKREVSGVVKDTTNNTVIGATVSLVSSKDTLRTSTNADGLFIFKNVQSGQFLLSVKSIGYVNYNKRFLYNDATKNIILDAVVLKAQNNLLNEVQINGTPAVTYKEDTVEYRASDYKVRENATVDELLKKMEGIEVDKDGAVTAQGMEVTRARVNGKTYSGGDVANAIQNLPADIVEKIQIVDDYGDQAARTGIKDGEPQKVLNIVTRSNRSVGNTGRVIAGLGNNERYGASVFGNRINANQQINSSLSYNNTVTGIAGGGGNPFGAGTERRNGGFREGNQGANFGSSGGSGGTAIFGRGSFGYRDKWNKKLEFNGSYSFNVRDNNSENNSTSQSTSSRGFISAENSGKNDNNGRNHNLNFDLEYEIDSANFLRIQPSLGFNSTLNNSNSNNLQLGELSSKLVHQRTIDSTESRNSRPDYGATLLYQHLFRKKGRNFSLNISYNKSDQNRENEQDIRILYFGDLAGDDVVKDSLANRIVQRKNLNSTFRQSMTFSERIGTKSRIDFNAQMNRRSYNNSAHTDNVINDSATSRVDSLSNVYNYSFTESRISLNYRFTEKKYNFSVGLTGIPTLLTGTKVHLGTSPRRPNFFLIPIARFEYQFSRQHRLSFNYAGNASEPTFDQIQPVRDVSRANNPVVGNPYLKAAFNHTLTASYNNYIAKSRLNYSVNTSVRVVNNSVISNNVQLTEGDHGGLINETHYTNKNGVSSFTARYNLSKSFADRKYSFNLNGSVTRGNGISMSNNVLNKSKKWTFAQRLGPRINPTDWLELNPNANFVYSKAEYTLSRADNWSRNLALSGDGKIYFEKTLFLSFSASKNFISGISSNLTTNPFVINTALEKQFFKRKNGALSLQVFDILKENNFINRYTTDEGFIDTKSNALSRYVMLNFRWTPQKWTGTPPRRNGRPMMRRGDGSFY